MPGDGSPVEPIMASGTKIIAGVIHHRIDAGIFPPPCRGIRGRNPDEIGMISSGTAIPGSTRHFAGRIDVESIPEGLDESFGPEEIGSDPIEYDQVRPASRLNR